MTLATKSRLARRLGKAANCLGKNGTKIEGCLQGAAAIFGGIAAIYAALNPPPAPKQTPTPPAKAGA